MKNIIANRIEEVRKTQTFMNYLSQAYEALRQLNYGVQNAKKYEGSVKYEEARELLQGDIENAREARNTVADTLKELAPLNAAALRPFLDNLDSDIELTLIG